MFRLSLPRHVLFHAIAIPCLGNDGRDVQHRLSVELQELCLLFWQGAHLTTLQDGGGRSFESPLGAFLDWIRRAGYVYGRISLLGQKRESWCGHNDDHLYGSGHRGLNPQVCRRYVWSQTGGHQGTRCDEGDDQRSLRCDEGDDQKSL